MNMKKKKRLVVLLVLTLAIALLAGCGSKNSGSNTTETNTPDNQQAENSGLDISKKVELQFYMLGDAPKDLSIIEQEINKMALEELNATVKFNYTTWTDWDQKYKLLLTSGQPIDLIFTADWTQYQAFAKKEAFLALDDLLPEAAPTLYSFVPEEMWEAVKVDGKIYTVPSTYKEYVTNGFVWREDLRKKYDLPVPNDLESFEAYMDGIKEHEPDIIPLSITDIMDNTHKQYLELSKMVGNLPYGIGVKYDSPEDVYSYWGSDEHKEELQMMKRWADKGFISKNVLNEKELDTILSGKSAAIMGENPTQYNNLVMRLATTNPDWELGYTPYGRITGYANPVHPIHNGFAVPANSKNPERALAFYEKLVTDERYNLLTSYGIEGTNYVVEDGYYTMLGDANSNGFPYEGMGSWAWRNPEYMLFDQSFDAVKEIFAELDQIQKPDIWTGFVEDYTAYQGERAALDQVVRQYLYPLQAGLIDDVDEGLALFMEKAKLAGLEKIQTEWTNQWLEYIQSIDL